MNHYIIEKDDLFLYKIKPNGYAYFSGGIERAKLFDKEKATELAEQYHGKVIDTRIPYEHYELEKMKENEK